MSGGVLTRYTHDLYRLTEWANSVERENPLLAEMLRDMNHLLDRYDYYMSGDIGQDSIRKEWGDFRSKWMLRSESSWNKVVIDRAKAEIDGYLESIRLGYRPEDADGS